MLQTRIKNRLIRRGIVALALLATLPGAPVAAGQTFDEAVAAYDRGDYATAVRGFLVHAEQGDATAQYNLGVMYALGEGVPENDAEAATWYRKAAEQGHASGSCPPARVYAEPRLAHVRAVHPRAVRGRSQGRCRSREAGCRARRGTPSGSVTVLAAEQGTGWLRTPPKPS